MRKNLTALTGGKAIGAASSLLLAKDNNDVVKRDAQREQLFQAFCAETGLHPSQCEQVTVHGKNGMRWYLRKRESYGKYRETHASALADAEPVGQTSTQIATASIRYY